MISQYQCIFFSPCLSNSLIPDNQWIDTLLKQFKADFNVYSTGWHPLLIATFWRLNVFDLASINDVKSLYSQHFTNVRCGIKEGLKNERLFKMSEVTVLEEVLRLEEILVVSHNQLATDLLLEQFKSMRWCTTSDVEKSRQMNTQFTYV